MSLEERMSEIRDFAIAANSGEASDEQMARFDELVRSNRQLANYAARLFDQQAALAWRGSMHGLQANAPSPADSERTVVDGKSPFRGEAHRRARWAWPAIAASVAFILGGAAAVVSYRALWPQGLQAIAADGSLDVATPTYEAHLVRSTACRWDGNSMGSHQIGSGLASGQSLNLLEGLAEFKLNWSTNGRATVSLEGPAAMMLTSEGMPTLRFGRLTATISAGDKPFVLETPVGRLAIDEFGSIGVSAFGNEGEIHIFKGSAVLEPAWRTSDEPLAPITIEAGEAVGLQTADNGQPSITHHAADPDYFAAQVSMSSDGLAISPKYVNAIKQAKPIGYWRFERDNWPRLPNLMGGPLECQINGEVGRTKYQGNESVEFGVTDQAGEILSNQAINGEIRDSYSVEFWVKPSHYHLGAMISLVGDTPMPSGILPHGMLLELGGTGKIPTATHHPGCVRFLHRSPAGDTLGTSCYSKSPYTLRKWQHVVATKDGAHMRLYVNGDLAAEGEDDSELPAGLRLLVGRLYPAQGSRPFIGQLDELALYNRALSPAEIAQHYQLVHPKTADGPSI